MGLKLNKIILILTFFVILNVNSQEVEDNYTSDTIYQVKNAYDSTYPDIESSYFNNNFHYNDSSKNEELNSKYNENLNRNKWKNEIQRYKFEEDKQPEIKQEDIKKYKKKSDSSISGVNLKYIFYFLAIGILIFVLIKIIPNKWNRNLDIDNKLKFEIDNLDHESIKQAELSTPLNSALNEGNYKEAYRIKYLQVLQLLIQNNLIYYSKEKTNYDYLIQLQSKTIHEPFKKLTFNFDGIWYGDIPINETLYHSLIPYFNEFESQLKNK